MARRLMIFFRSSILVVVVCLVGAFLGIEFFGGGTREVLGQTPKPLEKPPAGQTYVGSKECASCHFDQFLSWRDTKHAKGFEILPAKYKEDKSCLKCHTTGHGEATGFVSKAQTPGLVGTSCESCHGPGNKHAEIAKTFGKKKLDKDQEAYVRSTIHKVLPKNACAECHVTRGHKKHPEYVK